MTGLYQLLPDVERAKLPTSSGFARLTDAEESEAASAFADTNLRVCSVANAMWRKAHPRWRAGQPGHGCKVYVLGAPSVGLVKIGYSSQPNSRLSQHQTSSPVPLRLIGTVEGGPELERELHERFASCRSHGEWFRMTPALSAAIKELVK